MAENNQDNNKNLIDFFRIIGKLKHLKRTGWVKRAVSEPEDVAGHMYRMAVMAMVTPPPPPSPVGSQQRLDRERAVKMALVHDMAEALVGDLTPHCGVSDAEKHRRELAALESMVAPVGGAAAAEILSLFNEYETNASLEAQFVHDLDKFDMILQADQYETEQGRDLQEFFTSARELFRTETVLTLVSELNRQRTERRGCAWSDPAGRQLTDMSH